MSIVFYFKNYKLMTRARSPMITAIYERFAHIASVFRHFRYDWPYLQERSILGTHCYSGVCTALSCRKTTRESAAFGIIMQQEKRIMNGRTNLNFF